MDIQLIAEIIKILAPLIVWFLAYLNRRRAIPAFARPYVADIGEEQLVAFARAAESFTSLTSIEKANFVKNKIEGQIGAHPDSWDGIANFLTEYAYQLYKARRGW